MKEEAVQSNGFFFGNCQLSEERNYSLFYRQAG